MGRSLLPLSTLQYLKLHSDLAKILFICSAEFSELCSIYLAQMVQVSQLSVGEAQMVISTSCSV